MQASRSTWSATPWPKPGAWLGLAALLLCGPLLIGAASGSEESYGALFSENGPVEALQMAMLVTNVALFLAAFVRSQGVKANSCLGLTVLCAVAVIKEVERCGSGYDTGGYCAPAGAKHVAVLLVILAGLAALLLRGELRQNLKYDPGFLRLWPLCLALPLLGAAEIFDKLEQRAMEEPLELSAYILVGVYAVWLLRTQPATQTIEGRSRGRVA